MDDQKRPEEKGSLMAFRGFFREAKKLLQDGAKTSVFWGLVAAAVFNRRARRTLWQYIAGGRDAATRVVEAGVQEILEIVVDGLVAIFLSWVVLLFGNLALVYVCWIFFHMVWGWPHVIFNLVYLLFCEYVVLRYMAKRVRAVGLATGSLTIITSLVMFGGLKTFWESVGKAFEKAGFSVGNNCWRVVRMLMNERQYFTVGAIYGMLNAIAATGMPWLLVLPGAFSFYLWKVNIGSMGNNRTIEGDQVIDGIEYPVVRRVKDDRGTRWEKGVGHKPKLAGFQSFMQPVAAGVIIVTFVASWFCFFIYRDDFDHDGITNSNERVVFGTDPYNPNTDHDSHSDGEEVQKGFDPLFSDKTGWVYSRVWGTDKFRNSRPLAPSTDPGIERYRNRYLWAQHIKDSMAVARDSLRIVREVREDSLKAVVQAYDDSLKAAKLLHRDAGNGGTGNSDASNGIRVIDGTNTSPVSQSLWLFGKKTATAADRKAKTIGGATTYLYLVFALLFALAVFIMYKTHVVFAALLYWPLVLVFNNTCGFTWGGLEKVGYIAVAAAYFIGLLLVWGRWHDRRRLAY